MAYAVRSDRAGSSSFRRDLQQAVWSVKAHLPLANGPDAFVVVVPAIAASVALLLCPVGIYRVIAYIATQRTRQTYAAVSLGLAVVALLATWLPARRAARVDPVTALRAEG